MPGRIGSLQHHCARTVAKQHAGGAVLEIQNPAKYLGAHHQGTAGIAGAGSWHRPPSAHTQSRCTPLAHQTAGQPLATPSLFCKMAGGRRKHHVRRGRGDDDQVNVLRAARQRLNGLQAGLQAQVAADPPVVGEVAGRGCRCGRRSIRQRFRCRAAASSATRSALVSRRGGR